METKCWWKSKTIWFNAWASLFTVLEAQLGVLKAVIGPEAYPVFMVGILAVNMWLRTITTQPVGKP